MMWLMLKQKSFGVTTFRLEFLLFLLLIETWCAVELANLLHGSRFRSHDTATLYAIDVSNVASTVVLVNGDSTIYLIRLRSIGFKNGNLTIDDI